MYYIVGNMRVRKSAAERSGPKPEYAELLGGPYSSHEAAGRALSLRASKQRGRLRATAYYLYSCQIEHEASELVYGLIGGAGRLLQGAFDVPEGK